METHAIKSKRELGNHLVMAPYLVLCDSKIHNATNYVQLNGLNISNQVVYITIGLFTYEKNKNGKIVETTERTM